jgi:histidinol-phosphatase (PHP family)
MTLSSFHGGHSPNADGKAVAEIAKVAAFKNFVAFGFTEHFQTPPVARTQDPALQDQLALFDEYVANVQEAKREHPFVLLGTEIEYIRGALAWTRKQVSRWPFDYVVGSLHYVRVGDEDVLVDWERHRVEYAIEVAGGSEQLQLAYYRQLLELVEWKIATVIGHLDLIKMWLTPEEAVETPAIKSAVTAVLEAMRDSKMAMDVNARGLLKPCKRIYPDPWILEEARRIGVPVTLGDDSHSPSDVGLNLQVAVEAIARAGYKHLWLVRPGGELESSPLPRT